MSRILSDAGPGSECPPFSGPKEVRTDEKEMKVINWDPINGNVFWRNHCMRVGENWDMESPGSTRKCDDWNGNCTGGDTPDRIGAGLIKQRAGPSGAAEFLPALRFDSVAVHSEYKRKG